MIFLGNLSVEQIEKRLGIQLNDSDKMQLEGTRQERVNNMPIEAGKWHCYDLPFMFMTHDIETAKTFRDIFTRYDMTACKETFQIGWES